MLVRAIFLDANYIPWRPSDHERKNLRQECIINERFYRSNDGTAPQSREESGQNRLPLCHINLHGFINNLRLCKLNAWFSGKFWDFQKSSSQPSSPLKTAPKPPTPLPFSHKALYRVLVSLGGRNVIFWLFFPSVCNVIYSLLWLPYIELITKSSSIRFDSSSITRVVTRARVRFC